jgi:hypothetical protein
MIFSSKMLQMLQMDYFICNTLKTLYTNYLYTTVTDVTDILVKVYRDLVIQKSPLAFTYYRILKSLFLSVTICNTCGVKL